MIVSRRDKRSILVNLDLLDKTYSNERLHTLAIPEQRDFLKQFLKAFEETYKDHPIQAKATLVFQNLLVAKDLLLLDPNILERLLAAIPNPLALMMPDYISSEDEERTEIFEKSSPEYLEQLLSTILSIWRQEPEAFLGSFPCHLILFCVNQQIIQEPIQLFLLQLITRAPEEWLLEYWDALDTNLQITIPLFTETGKFNSFFKQTKKKILKILDQAYRGIFSSKLLNIGAEVYRIPDHDESQGHITFYGQWEYKTNIPFGDDTGHILTGKSLTVRLREEDRGLIGEIILSQNLSNNKDAQIIWDDYFLKFTIYQNLDVVQRYLFMKAYVRRVIKLGFDTVLNIALYQNEAGKAVIFSEEKPDFFYNSLQLKDPLKALEFIREFASELLRNVTQARFDSYSEILQKIYNFTK